MDLARGYTTVFLTGGAVLALEVMASRVMTPFFGVSLYIWAGILSVTMIFMAIGYRLGGGLSQRESRQPAAGAFLLMPALAALAIVGACAVYPVLFPKLAAMDLLLGNFLACAVLLAAPLVALSAMSPLLVSLLQRRDGDGGAGQVFFVSTLGSVAGVLLTAFVFMSRFTNFDSLLWTALGLAALTLINLPGSGGAPETRRLALICALLALASAAGLLGGGRSYLAAIAPAELDGRRFTILDERTSVFGNVKIARIQEKSGAEYKGFFQDGIIQNRVGMDGRSVAMYTYALERLSLAHRPEAKRVLVLGLGAGEVPMAFVRRGLSVDVVEINPDAVAVAQQHFGFDPARATVHVADARTFVRQCRQGYDLLIIDLFHGDSTPDYLLTREFMADAAACLAPDGRVVANLFFDAAVEAPNRLVLATAAAVFPGAAIYHPPLEAGGSGFVNAFLVAGRRPFTTLPAVDRENLPKELAPRFNVAIDHGRIVTAAELANVTPATDEFNPITVVFADSRKRFRQLLANTHPPLLLIN
ncbi:MAG: fused MFS/spermidine synthase [Magnetococcales bacterium]|nr:fused MFS/spermidine synthase [Magnetococcales bacterium]